MGIHNPSELLLLSNCAQNAFSLVLLSVFFTRRIESPSAYSIKHVPSIYLLSFIALNPPPPEIFDVIPFMFVEAITIELHSCIVSCSLNCPVKMFPTIRIGWLIQQSAEIIFYLRSSWAPKYLIHCI